MEVWAVDANRPAGCGKRARIISGVRGLRLSLADRRMFVIICRDDAFARIPTQHFSGGIFAGGR
jgi:hypothetical protein